MSWLALFAPRGTPDDRIARLNAEIAKIAAMPEAQKVLSAAGLDPVTNSPTRCARIIEADLEEMGPIDPGSGPQADERPDALAGAAHCFACV